MPLSYSDAENLRQALAKGTYGDQSTHAASGPGVLQELFNFISRPSRASAALAYDLTGGGGNPFKDVMGALAGHGTHTYKDVINNVAPGLPSWAKSVGGFAGDVLLDPLTYATGGVTKGIGSLEAGTQALKGLTEAGVLKRGLQVTPELLDTATQAVKKANPSSLQFGFKIPFSGGKTLMKSTLDLPGEMGTKLSESYNALKDVVLGPESARRAIPRAFSRANELPLTSDIMTNNQAVAHSLMGDTKHHIEGMFGANLTDAEQKAIALVDDAMSKEAIAAGRKNPLLGALHNERPSTLKTLKDELGNPAPHPLSRPDVIHPEGYQDLGDYHNLAKNLHKTFLEEERKLGLRGTNETYGFKGDEIHPEVQRAMDESLPRYYHYDFEQSPTGIGKQYVNENTGQKFYNERSWANSHALDDPAIAHLNPVTNIQDIMGIRTGTHFKDVGLANYNLEALKQVGIPLTAKTRSIIDQGMPGIGKFVKVGEDTIGHPTAGLEELNKLYVPQSVADSMKKINQTLRNPKEASGAMQGYDKVLRSWKKVNTVYSPGFHIHNSISDFLMNWADGVKGVKPYQDAAKILSDASNKTSASFLEHLAGKGTADEMLGATGIKAAIEASKTITLGGQQFPIDRVNELMRPAHGGIVGQLKTESLSAADQAAASSASKAQDLIEKGKNALGSVNGLADKASAMSGAREKFFRSAHMLNEMDQAIAKGATLEEAAAQGVSKVRKFNIDYSTQTEFEKNVARRIIPFYSWARRNLPLQAQMLFTHPGFMAGYAKGQNMLNGGIVGSTDVNGDPLLPQWLRDSLPMRLASGKAQDSVLSKFISAVSGGRAGQGVYANLASSLTPMNDLSLLARPIDKTLDAGSIAGAPLNFAKGLLGEASNMASPAIKIPFELGMNRNLSTGGPLDLKGVKDWAGYLGAQTAVGRVGSGAVDPTNRPKTLTNFLSGVNLTPVTPERQMSEFYRQQSLINKHLNDLKGQEAQQRGIPNTMFNKPAISKLNNPQIQKLKQQLKQLRKLATALPPDYQPELGQAGYVSPFG